MAMTRRKAAARLMTCVGCGYAFVARRSDARWCCRPCYDFHLPRADWKAAHVEGHLRRDLRTPACR
jgi:hypothetical protein